MKRIKLTQNKWALVDSEDYPLLSKYNWHAVYRKGSMSFAAKTHFGDKDRYMHRIITNCPTGLVVDHINHDTLDNRKKNLRICTKAQNTYNSSKRRKNRCGYKGVSINYGKYFVQIKKDGHAMCLGRFNNLIEAAKAYDKKAKELFGEFACLNFPQE